MRVAARQNNRRCRRRSASNAQRAVIGLHNIAGRDRNRCLRDGRYSATVQQRVVAGQASATGQGQRAKANSLILADVLVAKRTCTCKAKRLLIDQRADRQCRRRNTCRRIINTATRQAHNVRRDRARRVVHIADRIVRQHRARSCLRCTRRNRLVTQYRTAAVTAHIRVRVSQRNARQALTAHKPAYAIADVQRTARNRRVAVIDLRLRQRSNGQRLGIDRRRGRRR